MTSPGTSSLSCFSTNSIKVYLPIKTPVNRLQLSDPQSTDTVSHLQSTYSQSSPVNKHCQSSPVNRQSAIPSHNTLSVIRSQQTLPEFQPSSAVGQSPLAIRFCQSDAQPTDSASPQVLPDSANRFCQSLVSKFLGQSPTTRFCQSKNKLSGSVSQRTDCPVISFRTPTSKYTLNKQKI